MPYWYAAELDEDRTGLLRTEHRIDAMRRRAQSLALRNPRLTDLVGYLNFRLTGQLTINTIAACELGFTSAAAAAAALGSGSGSSVLVVGAPAECCGRVSDAGARDTGVERGTPVSFGSSDSLASAIAGGVRNPGDLMIYLGTFGSLFEGLVDVERALRTYPRGAPYVWRVSVPRYGAILERVAYLLYGPTTGNESRLALLDAAARTVAPGAEGIVLLCPVWDALGAERGGYRFRRSRRVATRTRGQTSRAVLESVGYAVRALAPLTAAEDRNVYVAGGGSSAEFVSILAAVLGRSLRYAPDRLSAIGTALIATMMAEDSDRLPQPPALEAAAVAPRDSEVIQTNLEFATLAYASSRR